MNLIELAGDKGETEGAKGAKIPWNDPDFSRRMLQNHLAQEHDWASRRHDIIVRHTGWIASQLKPNARILDLGCGPGLYTQNLAAFGHHCIGVDFSPASIEYARTQAMGSDLKLEYVLSDIRGYRTDTAFDCILMTFGEFNVFTREDATDILGNCSRMMRDGGLLILETHTYDAVRTIGTAPATWQRQAGGLFSDKPHLCLQENIWNAADSSALCRYFIVDAETAKVQPYASFMQAYTIEQYEEMLLAAKLPSQRVLTAEEWLSGQEFEDKLRVYICIKTSTAGPENGW